MNPLASRLRASLRPATLHLGLSVMVALLAMGLVFLLWYPGALARAQGVTRLVPILIGVDVVIGPLITLIVYVPGKKSLRFDLAAIATMQLTALLYGLYAIQGGRPAYVVFNVDRFDVVAPKELDGAGLDHAAAALRLSWFGPKWVAARMPADPKKSSEILFSAMDGGPDLPQMPEFYIPLEDERPQILARLHPMAELRTLNELDESTWQRLLLAFGKLEPELGYLPLSAGAQDAAVILDRQTGDVLGVRQLTPRFEAPGKRGGAG